MTKHISHDKHVTVFVFYADSVHAQELGQKRVAMTLDYILGKTMTGRSKRRMAGTAVQVLLLQSQAGTLKHKGCKAKGWQVSRSAPVTSCSVS